MVPLRIARRDAFALACAAAAWGFGTVISKRALDDVDALVLLPIQLAASLVLLSALMLARGARLSGSPAGLARLGILNPGLAYALGLLGLASISASVAVLLWAIEPLLILVLAAALLQERITRVLVGLSIVAAIGMMLLLYEPAIAGAMVGIALSLAGVACCAAYSIVARRWLADADSTAQVVIAQQAWGLVFAILLVVATMVLQHVPTIALTPGGLASAIGSGVLYYGAAYWMYLGALRRVPASVAAASFYLIPVFGVGAGRVLLGEQLDPLQWIGAATILVAVLGIMRSSLTLGPSDADQASVVIAGR